MTLEVGDENITITDKGDNGMTFPLVSENPTEDAPETAKVLIQKIQDAVGNEVTVTAVADSPLKIALTVCRTALVLNKAVSRLQCV